jgi:abhydrolase domain-containing protein 6
MGRQSIRKSLFTLSVVIFSLTCAGCNKHDLFTKAIALERYRSHLAAHTQNLSFGKIVYLSNDLHDEKETIVMLHGFGANKDTWVRFARGLSDDYYLIIPDLPGDGDSTRDMSLNYGINNQAKRLDEFLSKLEARKVHIVANSMGGAIALRYAYMYPDMVRSLTLIDTYGAIRTPSALDALIQESGRNPMLEISSASDYERMMNYVMVDPPYIPDFMIDVLAETKKKRHAIEQKMLNDMTRDADQTAILEDIHVPTLIIWGKGDKVISVDNAEFIHERIAGSKKVLLDGAGHVPMVEKTKETVQYFQSFIENLNRKAPSRAFNGES